MAKKSKKSFLDFLTLEDWTDKLTRNVGKKLNTRRRVMWQKSADLIFIAGEP
jgi:hypothetical protein